MEGSVERMRGLSSLKEGVNSPGKRIERSGVGVDQLRDDPGSLRGNVINVLIAELERRMERG